ncbi:unnamed protein product [Gulo gulo]|jgi:L-fuconolactonase
MP